MGYGSYGRKELDTTEATEHACTHTILRNGVKAHKLSLYHLLKLHVDLQVSQIEKQQKALIKKFSAESTCQD